MGWNTLQEERGHPLWSDIKLGPSGLHAYFVHSYHFRADAPEAVTTTTEYGGKLAAMVGRGNIAGVQFHPEKSQTLGLKFIANFLRWTP
jgi:glutamine amidotransferase